MDLYNNKFKILKKELESSDYSRYKCEAANLVGKSEAFVELLGEIHFQKND